ncbi:hypothetical protein ACP6JD_002893 [Aspergillus fumigatus]
MIQRDAAVEVLVKEGNLAQDVVAHTGHFTEEEEGEGASSNTEGGSNGSAADKSMLEWSGDKTRV